MADDEYIEEIRVVRRKTDTYRSNSSKTKEFESDLLRSKSTRNVAGPTESRPIDEDELRRQFEGDQIVQRDLSPSQQALADAIVELGAVVLRQFVIPLVSDAVIPAARARVKAVTERRRLRAEERTQVKVKEMAARISAAMEADEREPTTSMSIESAEPTVVISRRDFVVAQLQLKLAEDYAAQQRWLIAHAEVTGDDLSPELEEPLFLMLEGRSGELSDEQRDSVAVYLSGSRGAVRAEDAISDKS